MNSAATNSMATGEMQVIARVPPVATNASVRAAPARATANVPHEYSDLAGIIAQSLAPGAAVAVREQLLSKLAPRFGAMRVAIGWQRPGQSTWLLAVSGDGVLNLRSALGRALQAACAESWVQAKGLEWPSANGERGTPPTFRQLAELTNAPQVFGTPLRAENAAAPVVLLAWGEQPLLNKLREVPWNDLSPSLAGLVRILDDATPSRWSAAARTISILATRRWLALMVVSILVALAFIPVPDRVNCSATLEPQLRRYVVAPMDGTLEKSLVRTGDQVTAGQCLALLDARPLKMELSVQRGELDEANKRRAAAQAKGQAALTQMAALEAEQITAKIAYLQHQQEQLTVVSPVTGVIVRGELERVEGAPLTRGNTMFEVAPLSELVAEVAVPEEEVQLVKAGMQVTLWPASLPGRSITGTIARVHPRAEIRDHQSVFIAEVVLDNKQQVLRPGMQAQAIVWSHTEFLGWTLIRRPFLQLTRWLWW